VHGIKGHAWKCRTAGNKPATLGIETIVCGPGDVAQAHTNAELIGQMERAAHLSDRSLQS
jgi:hypothetical protein